MAIKKMFNLIIISHGVSTQVNVNDENTSVMGDIVGHNGRIVALTKGKTYQIALTPRID